MSRRDLAADGTPPRQTPGQATRWDTQDAAWESMQPRLNTINHRVLAAIVASPRTCDELEQDLALTHQTCSASVNNLMRRGLIVAEGYRKTRSGRSARVWRAAQSEFLFPIGLEKAHGRA
jgi:predicted Rossmann fold nucleotide-binding protein DprA/Smf involved in DNA uptake